MSLIDWLMVGFALVFWGLVFGSIALLRAWVRYATGNRIDHLAPRVNVRLKCSGAGRVTG